MNAYAAALKRPLFRADGRVVARRQVHLGKVYERGQDIPAGAVDARQLQVLWDQMLVDTLPPHAHAPAQKRK